MLMLRWAELQGILCEGGMSLAVATNAGLLGAHATGEATFLCLSTVLCAVSAKAVTLCFDDRDVMCKLTVRRLTPKLKLSRWPIRLTTCKPMHSSLMSSPPLGTARQAWGNLRWVSLLC